MWHSLFSDETNMPLEIILKAAAQKRMKIKFRVDISWHGVPRERTENQINNLNIFE